MIKQLRIWYYLLVPTYRRLDLKLCSYAEANLLIKTNCVAAEEDQWHIAKEEDDNRHYGYVWLERKERIYA